MPLIYGPKGRAQEYSKWALNLGTGCTNGCQYCYAPSCLFKSRGEFYGGFKPKKDLFPQLIKEARQFKHKDEQILLSFTHDPYQNNEVASITRGALIILKDNGCHFQILTKNGSRALRDFDLYGDRDSFATTLTFWHDEQSAKVEPGADRPQQRMLAIRDAKRRGIETWVSFEPVLDEESVYEIYEEIKDYVDLFKVGKVSRFSSNVRNWKAFGEEMVSRFKRDGKDYYIKQDLREEMEK